MRNLAADQEKFVAGSRCHIGTDLMDIGAVLVADESSKIL